MRQRALLRGAVILSGGVLLGALWLPWYRIDTGNFLVLFGAGDVLQRFTQAITAWRAFAYTDVVLAAIGAYTLLVGAMFDRLWRAPRPTITAVVLPMLLAVGLVAYRITSPPTFAIRHAANVPPLTWTVRYGAYVALLSATGSVIALLIGARQGHRRAGAHRTS
jgi:hypothetical protein